MVNLPLDGEQTDTHTASGCGPGTLVVGVILAGLCKVVACAAAVHGVSTDLTYATSEGMCVPQKTMTSALVVSLLFVVYFIYHGKPGWSKKIVQSSPEVIGRRTVIL